jgi:aspartate racemase
MNIDFIVIICNTIHLYYDSLRISIKAPLIDLRDEVKKYLVQKDIKDVLIIATPLSIKKGLYRFNSLKTYDPTDEELEEISEVIFNYNKGVNKEKQKEKVISICKRYQDKGVGTIISGCTELSLMLKDEKIEIIDTMNVLIDKVIEEIKDMSKKDKREIKIR